MTQSSAARPGPVVESASDPGLALMQAFDISRFFPAFSTSAPVKSAPFKNKMPVSAD
jgi:hypothetical protein